MENIFDNISVVDSTAEQNTNKNTYPYEQQVEPKSCFSCQHYSECFHKSQSEQPLKQKKIKWKKVTKFFVSVVKPILDYIPKFLYALAHVKRAFAHT